MEARTPNPRCWQACAPSGSCWGESLPCLCQLLVAVAFLDLWPHPSKLCLPGHTVSSSSVCAKSLLASLLKGAWLGFRAHSDNPGTAPHLKIFTQSHLQKLFFQNREHSQPPGVRTWAYIVWGGAAFNPLHRPSYHPSPEALPGLIF